MHAIIETPTYLADAKAAGLGEDELAAVARLVASDPRVGDLMVGSGGARKVRVARSGQGKSGGYRIVVYYAAEDVPVFLLALIDKGERANLSKAERNVLRDSLARVADDYRDGVRRKMASVRRRQRQAP